jgi:hypothetical protein
MMQPNTTTAIPTTMALQGILDFSEYMTIPPQKRIHRWPQIFKAATQRHKDSRAQRTKTLWFSKP